MRITADTNVLVRALVQDDPVQARVASALLAQAELVVVPLPVMCELVWMLRRVDRPAVRAGLQLLGATNWRPLTMRQRGVWLQLVSRCVCFFELIRRTSP